MGYALAMGWDITSEETWDFTSADWYNLFITNLNVTNSTGGGGRRRRMPLDPRESYVFSQFTLAFETQTKFNKIVKYGIKNIALRKKGKTTRRKRHV